MKYFENKRVKNTINKIEGLKKEAVSHRIYGVRMSLERVNSTLINRSGRYTRKQYRMVDECLNKVARSMSDEYSSLIKNECLKASSIILGTYSEPSKSEQLIQEDQQLVDELDGKLRRMKERLDTLSKDKDEALGRDEITWKRLNREESSLKNQYMAVEKAFNTLLAHTGNLQTADAVRGVNNRYMSRVIEQQSSVDVEEFRDNAEANQYAYEESSRQSDEMSKILYDSAADDDDAYRKALEEKLLRESGSSSPAPNLSEPVVGSSLEKGELKVAR